MFNKSASQVAVWGLLALSFMAGFLSMSQEIVWVALLSFTTSGVPAVFANVLGFLLLGTAAGSVLGSWLTRQSTEDQWIKLGHGALIAAMVYGCSIIFLSRIFVFNETVGYLTVYVLILFVALLWGASFPVLCGAWRAGDQSVGLRVSWVYLVNISGAVCGPLMTGYVLLETLSLNRIVALISLGSLGFVVLAWRVSRVKLFKSSLVYFPLVLTMAIAVVASTTTGVGDLARLQWKESYFRGNALAKVLQSRHGIIAVKKDSGGDILYGGGAYDGRYSLDPVINSNGITRAFMLASLHRKPAKVLMIGLGSGSWASVVASHEGVNSLDIVEINPGYVELLGDYPEISGILNNPKVSLTIDDGRRWLRQSVHEDYDVIIMNTSFHWRSNMTYLLSEEFFELCRNRLKQGGLLYFNTTFSKDVIYTVAEVFPYVTNVEGFAAASLSPFNLSQADRFNNLLKFRKNGKSVLDPSRPEARDVLMHLASMRLPDVKALLAREPDLLKITDDNMATEYKRERRWYNPEWSWFRLWQRLQE